jgi:hypothetical protein
MKWQNGITLPIWWACSLAFGQATAVIEGPQQVSPGDLVILDASKSQADSLVWTLANSDKSFLQFEGGRKCVFASGAVGTYTFVLSTAKSTESGNASVAAAKFVLAVGPISPINPQPLPGPTPGPGPIVPNPPQPILSSVASGARDSAIASNRKPGESALIADDFERIASQGAGLSWTVPQMQSELKKSRLITDADINARWQPFRDWFRTQAPAMQTPEKTRDVFTEIALGLRAVEKVGDEPAASGDARNETLKDRVKNINGILDEIANEVGN